MANVTYDKNCLTVLDHPLVGHKDRRFLRDESTAPHFRKASTSSRASEAYEGRRAICRCRCR